MCSYSMYASYRHFVSGVGMHVHSGSHYEMFTVWNAAFVAVAKALLLGKGFWCKLLQYGMWCESPYLGYM